MSSLSATQRHQTIARFALFIETHPPNRVSAHLRNILIDYIAGQLETGLPIDFHQYLWELYDLFQVLDSCNDEEVIR